MRNAEVGSEEQGREQGAREIHRSTRGTRAPAWDTATTTSDTLAKKLQVKMYPNPAQNYTVLQLNQDVTPLQLQITSNLGQTIFNQPIATVNGQYIINTVSYSSGLYYVALYSDTGKIFGDKLNVISK